MDKKPKARRDPRKAKRKIDDKKQSERFIQAARQLGVDETADTFEREFSLIASKKKADN